MNQTQYNELAAKLRELETLFKPLRHLEHVRNDLGAVLDKPASGYSRLQFEIETVNAQGMYERRMVHFQRGDFLFHRCVKEFRSIMLRVNAEAEKAFEDSDKPVDQSQKRIGWKLSGQDAALIRYAIDIAHNHETTDQSGNQRRKDLEQLKRSLDEASTFKR